MTRYLHIGGLIAIGFDPTGQFMLTISHSGGGVYHVGEFKRVARDLALAYPNAGHGIGIGPIDGLCIPVTEMDYSTRRLSVKTPDGRHYIEYSEGTVMIESTSARSLPESQGG